MTIKRIFSCRGKGIFMIAIVTSNAYQVVVLPVTIDDINRCHKIAIRYANKISKTKRIYLLQYMYNDEWLRSYRSPVFGIPPSKFITMNSKVISRDVKVNDFPREDLMLLRGNNLLCNVFNVPGVRV